MHELADALLVTRSGVTRLIDRLADTPQRLTTVVAFVCRGAETGRPVLAVALWAGGPPLGLAC